MPVRGFFDRNLHLAGILAGRPLIGPWAVQLDPTNRCTNRCIACWTHSPLYPLDSLPDQQSQLTLEEIRRLLYDLSTFGTKMIYLSGGGEPFCHPDIWSILQVIKELKLDFSLHTNMLWGNRGSVERLLSLEPAQVTISLWATSPATYALTNPSRSEEDFHGICSSIQRLTSARHGPRSKIHFVISKLNYTDMDNLLDFAHRMGVDMIEVAPVDPIPDVTSSLAIGDQERTWLDRWQRSSASCQQSGIAIEGLDTFCECFQTSEGTDRGQRLSELFPCLVGYFSCRIMATGEVLYCLKAHRSPMGNIKDSSFAEIWTAPPYQELRDKGKDHPGDYSAFNFIGNNERVKPGCLAACDDLPTNLLLRSRLARLPGWKRHTLLSRWARRYYYL